MHRWGEVELRPEQVQALRALETLLASASIREPICLTGDFGVGKTTLARYWLAQHFEEPEPYYCALNRPLLDALKEEGDLDHFAEVPVKARFILQVAATDLLEGRFKDAPAFVIDACEVLWPYRISPVRLVQRYAREGHVVLICLPESPSWSFRFNDPPFEVHRIELRREAS